MEWETALRLVLSAVLGGLVGLERAWRKKPAGMRTHVMVCLGSALIMLISLYMAEHSRYGVTDPSRMAANVVVGLGFLGAGTIMHAKGSVQGLTTAASLWAVGGIGLAVGCGFYSAAILSLIIMLFTLHVLDRLESYLVQRAGPRAKSAIKNLWFGGD